VGIEDSQHLLTCIRKKLLRIAGICDRLAFLRVTGVASQYTTHLAYEQIALQFDVAQVDVGDVPDENPPHFEYTLPLVRGPYCAASGVIDLSVTFSIYLATRFEKPYGSQHLRHPAEMTTDDSIRNQSVVQYILPT
jgi:hypothetical protein